MNGAGWFTADVQAVARQMRDSLLKHPSLEEFLSYLADEAFPADAYFLREHLSLCPDCCQAFLKVAAADGAAAENGPSQEEVEAAWRKLRPRLPLVSQDSRVRRDHARIASRLAAALLIACLGLSTYALSLRRAIHDLKKPQSIPIAELIAREDARRGDEQIQSVHVPRNAERLVLLLGLLDGGDYDRYRASFQCDGGPPFVESVDGLRRNPDGDFTVEIPRDFLPAGHCQIRLHGLKEKSARQVASYDAEVTYE